MKSIEVPFTVGAKQCILKLSQPLGAGGGYQISVDNWYQGQVVKTLHGWRVYLNSNSELSPEDCQVILEAVERGN